MLPPTLKLSLPKLCMLACTGILAAYGALVWWPEMSLLGRRGLGVDIMALAGGGALLLAQSWRAWLALVLLLLAAESLGAGVTKLGRLGTLPGALRVLLGLPLVALWGLALGTAGQLGEGPVWAAVLVALGGRLWGLRSTLGDFSLSIRRFGWFGAALWGALALLVWPTLVALLHPTVFYDALVYHLALPKAYLLSGSTAPLPWNVYSHFPACGELLFTLAWALGGQLAAQLLALAWWALGCLALGHAARAAGGPVAGRWALALAALTPCFLSSAGLVGVDVLAAALSAGAAWALARLFVPPAPPAAPGASDLVASAAGIASAGGRAWLGLAALFAAAAGSCKPPSLALVGVPVACAGVLALYQRRIRAQDLVMAGAAAGALLLPWLLRSAWATGNPLYPLPLLGASLPPAVYQAMQQDAHAGAFDPSAWWRMIFAAPMAQQREFGVAAFVGLAPWVGLPAWLVSRPPLAQRLLAGLLAVSLVLWLATFHLTRFAFSAIGLAVVLSACGLAWLQVQGPRRLAFVTVLVALAGHAVMNLAYSANQAAWLTQGFARLRLGLDAHAYLKLRARDRPVELGSLRAGQALAGAGGLSPMATLGGPASLSLSAGPQAQGSSPERSRVLTVGEPASLYLPGDSLAPTGVDGSPLLDLLATAPAAAVREELLTRGITHVLYRQKELGRLAAQYGWPLTPAQGEQLQTFFALLGEPLRSAGPTKLYSLTGNAGQTPTEHAAPTAAD